MKPTPTGIVPPKPVPPGIKIWGDISKKRLGEMIAEMIHYHETFIVDASGVRAVSGCKVDRPR